MIRRALAAVIERLARLGDPTVCRWPNSTDEDDGYRDHGYHDAATARRSAGDVACIYERLFPGRSCDLHHPPTQKEADT